MSLEQFAYNHFNQERQRLNIQVGLKIGNCRSPGVYYNGTIYINMNSIRRLFDNRVFDVNNLEDLIILVINHEMVHASGYLKHNEEYMEQCQKIYPTCMKDYYFDGHPKFEKGTKIWYIDNGIVQDGILEEEYYWSDPIAHTNIGPINSEYII